MNKYQVEFTARPFYACAVVEAEDPKSAIKIAFEEFAVDRRARLLHASHFVTQLQNEPK